MTNSNKKRYIARLQRVLDYISEHLDEKLDLDQLADVAALSRFHWHRTYHAIYGETIHASVKRLRMHRAATLLREENMPVKAVAKAVGYPNLQSFNRVFKERYGVPPVKYRNIATLLPCLPSPVNGDQIVYPVEIKEIEPRQFCGILHKGPYPSISASFGKFWAEVMDPALFRPHQKGVAVYLDDPGTVQENALRSYAGIAHRGELSDLKGCEHFVLEGGTYAVLLFKGPYPELEGVYSWLYGSWLPESGRIPRELPVYEYYLNSPDAVAPGELLTEICVPLVAQ